MKMDLFKQLKLENTHSGVSTGKVWLKTADQSVVSVSPVDGEELATIGMATEENFNEVVEAARKAFSHWKNIPAPRRGEVVRQIGLALREKKDVLGRLVSYEMGK